MNVELKFITPSTLVVDGIRKCWKSDNLSDSDRENDILGEKDKALIKRIIEFGHTSTLEHSLITFDISGISRALLQELSRHRVGTSPSVESTRYTLKKILKGDVKLDDILVSCGNELIDNANKEHMIRLINILRENDIPNDKAKYGIVEAFCLTEQISFNFRAFRSFLKLRTAPQALWEIRQLAYALYDAIPENYRIFFEDCVHER